MRPIITILTSFVALFVFASCDKDYISPDELFKDGSMVAKTTIHTKTGDLEDTVTGFRRAAVYKKSDMEGQSWFIAFSGGKMVYDAFVLSIYFDGIDKMKVGEALNPSRFWFSFFFSSDSRASTSKYGGKITLAAKGEDYVFLRFHKVSVSCSFGKYVTDGYLYCQLIDDYYLEGWIPPPPPSGEE